MVKNQITLKLALSALAVALLFGCATPTSAPVRTPSVAVVATAPAVAAPPIVSQEAALDKNEVIIDKPAPVQTEVVSLLAKITQVQLARLNQALKTASDEANSATTVSQAMPKIRAFVERLSCIRQYNDGGSAVLQNMAAPGVSFKFFVPPMHGTKLHNKNNCLTVNAIALKPLSYKGLAGIQIKVSYIAEDSGETTTSNHEINKNSKGVWWFTR
jgi:hypothetical protein